MSGVAFRLQAIAFTFVVVFNTSIISVQAQGIINMPKLSAALANELVGESVAICQQRGYKVVAVVADLDGVQQALLRGDGAPVHSLNNAYYKAYSAASLTLALKESGTKEVSERLAKNPPSTVPPTQLPNVTYAIGGVTIRVGDVAIGAIGVSGAPNGLIDEGCAKAALAKIQDRLK
ncbi:uncharacterized protein, possibly involved in utilization of glycolate and propanediol [Synechococcus sp. PCC 7502]|uniref:GlcG/HbpS family heme-binding protein n=1 Tax=Synechococcus sp. PCC 7502 TaxID=1173263 RepID=UPI00029F847C|nr:heme-binding protein [Synechococcus sp. PCC 7502]AFY74014.1 uncharacterized protein, possibly involved in utilization of glycolate and propanediol [Synechococcus sp. PCC 7502]